MIRFFIEVKLDTWHCFKVIDDDFTYEFIKKIFNTGIKDLPDNVSDIVHLMWMLDKQKDRCAHMISLHVLNFDDLEKHVGTFLGAPWKEWVLSSFSKTHIKDFRFIFWEATCASWQPPGLLR